MIVESSPYNLQISGSLMTNYALWALLIVALVQNVLAVDLAVTETGDSAADAANCYPVAGACNLRSAWDACNQLTEQCAISLPVGAEIAFNTTLGHLVLNDTAHIEISGAGSTVTNYRSGSTGSFIRWQWAWSVPTLSIRNLSVVGFVDEAAYGGAMSFTGDAVLTIDSCTFSDNSALSGGAVFVSDNSHGIQISNTVFESCYAVEWGGALTLYTNVLAASITGSTFSHCTADNSGGGIFLSHDNYDAVIANTVFAYNYAPSGGAMFVWYYNHGLTIANATFDHCSAYWDGGGVELQQLNNNIRIENTAFVDCTTQQNAGGLKIGENNHLIDVIGCSFIRCTAYEGGGAYVQTSNEYVHIAHSVFTDCIAGNSGGGIDFYQYNNYLTIEYTNFTNGQAMFGGGSSIEYQNYAAVISHNVYTNCMATDDSEPLKAAGGGAYNLNNNDYVLIEHCQFIDCTSTGYAGAVYIDWMTDYPVVTNSYFERCSAGKNGGGMWTYQVTELYVLHSTFSNCTAEKGAAVFVEVESASFVISDVMVTSCAATIHGGGVYIGNGNDNGIIQDSQFADCHADGNGGAIYVDNANTDMQLLDSVIDSCTATLGGGLLSGRNDGMAISGTVISNCAAEQAGGGLNFVDQNVGILIHSCEISDNTAGTYGGGLVSEGLNSGLQLVGTQFLRNQAAEQGGGVYLATGNAEFTVIDVLGYEGVRTVESPHPYSYFDASSETVSVTNATSLILYFDQHTRLSRIDSVYIYTDESKSELLFSQAGSSLWPGVTLPALRLARDSFYIELETYSDFFNAPTATSDNVYGYRLYVTPVFETPSEVCVFEGNIAGRSGGGLFMFSGVAFPIILNADFIGNRALDGGGMALRNAITGMTIEASRFVDNVAMSNGGGLLVASASYGLLVLDCLFLTNTAVLGGGAVAFVNNNGNDGKLVHGNENTIAGSDFEGNSAGADGGALFIALNNRLVMIGCDLTGNTANIDGGAVALYLTNVLHMEGCALHDNVAHGSGGGLASRIGNGVELAAVNITDNVADRTGGAINLNASTFLTFFDTCTLDNNTAGEIGGGIALFTSPQVVVGADGHLSISNNRAQRGSGIYFNALIERPGRTMRYTSFAGNEASVGGTVFWVFDQSMRQEPAGVADASVLWGDNRAPYGNFTATQAVRLIAPSGFEVQSYGNFISPAPVISLRDYYHNFMPLNGPTSIQTSISGASADQCDGRFPYLSGTDVLAAGVEMSAGQAKLRSLEASCAPLGHITLNFAAQLHDLHELDVEQYVISNTTAVTFRACRTGEVIVNGQCVVCPRGTFSLEETVSTDTICKECLNIDGVHACSGSTIVLEKNYWRRYPSSLAVLPCMDDLSGCNGGSATGIDSCIIGYEGALCSVCSEGYYRSEKQCLPCGDKNPTLTPVIIFYICIAVFCGLVVGFILYRRMLKNAENAAPGKYSAFFANVAMWLNKVKKSMNVQLKILITTFQITSTIPTSMEVEFPPSFMKYLNAVSVFNLNIVSIVPINCGHSGYNFIDKMVMITLAPIFASIGLFLLCIVEYILYMSRARPADMTVDEHNTKKSKIISRWLTYFFFLTYLVLPSVSTTIFKTFLCTNLDPLNEDDNNSDLYLTADMRVSCSTDYYKRAVAYASIMILVYVVGIPAMYLAFLWRCRKAIMSRYDPADAVVEVVDDAHDSVDAAKQKTLAIGTVDVLPGAAAGAAAGTSASVAAGPAAGAESTSKAEKEAAEAAEQDLHLSPVGNLATKKDPDSHMALMISFLYEAYEPEYWYWEVIETTRRLMLTAVLSVCGTGSAAQSIFAVLLALMYIKLYGFYSPYNIQADDIVAETGQFQIFLSFLGALIYQRQLLGTEWNDWVSLVLILINTSVFFLFIYFGWRTLSKAIKDSKIGDSPFGHGINLIRMPTMDEISRRVSPKHAYAPHSKVHVMDSGEDGGLPAEDLAYIRMRNGGAEEGEDTLIRERNYGAVAGSGSRQQTDSAHVSAFEIEHV